MARLFSQDLANVESGIYPLPEDHDGSLLTLIDRSRLFFEDLPEIHRRRERRAYNEVLSQKTRGKRPRYYLQEMSACWFLKYSPAETLKEIYGI